MKSESKIICKYFIHGKCIKGEKCPYLHSQFKLEEEDISERECPMYSVGYCKNGPMCKFIHVKKDENGDEIIDNDTTKIINDDTSSTPYDEDSITISYHEEKEEKEKEEKEEKEGDNKKEEFINNKIIPIWYLEHYYDKPISAIFSELESQNLPEVISLQKKYKLYKKDNQINMNLNFKNFDMNFAFNNYYSFNLPVNNIMVEQYPLYLNNNFNNYFYNTNPHLTKIEYIEYIINNFPIKYHLVKFKNFEYIRNCQITNQIEIPFFLFKKYKYTYNNIIIIILIYNSEDEEFSGFAKLEYPIKEKEENKKSRKKYKIKWLWKDGINYSEVSHLVNKYDKNHFLYEGKDWSPIHPDLGNYMCRLMLKRLNQEEVFELINEKHIFQEQFLFNQYKSKKNFEEDDSDKDNNENDINDIDYDNKKIYDEDNTDNNKDGKIYNYWKKRKRNNIKRY